MKKIFSKEVIIGLSVLVALAILFFGIDFLKGINVFKAANYYYASFTNVEGLAVSAPVTINGYKVGQVRSIEYEYDNPGHVLVEMSLNRELRVPTGSKAILSADLLGTASIKLQLSSASDNHEIGDKLIGENESGLMDAVGQNLLPAVGSIMPKIDSLLTSINALVASPALLASVQRLDNITAQLEVTFKNLAVVSNRLAPIAGDVQKITGNVAQMTGDLAVVGEELKNALLDSILVDLQATSNNLKDLTQQLNDPNSSIGKLMNDPALYNNINSTIQSLDSLFVDIKRNPKRYVTIKVF